MNDLGFAGIWDTNWGTLELQVQGVQVGGVYEGGGRVEGLAGGNLLRGTWVQPHAGGHGIALGRMTLSLAPDGRSFAGDWSYTDNNAPGGGPWTGKRRSARQP
jgi:hypothetical protein